VVSSEHRSTHGGTRSAQGELRRVPLEGRRQLMHLSNAIGAQPNKRVKLAAPAVEATAATQRTVLYNYCVNTSSSRRSLRASR